MSDTSSMTACPDAATLRALLDGILPDAQQAATQTHVDRCPTCEAALRQMTAGGESWIGMAEKLKGSGDDDPKLTAALERLKADDGSGSESSTPATDPQRTLDFLQPVDDPKLLGKLGRHEISEVVGWGGMGVVLKAYDPSLHRVVAVKVLASHLAHHAVARKRFIREAQAAAAVCHDNVVTIHAIEDGGQPTSYQHDAPASGRGSDDAGRSQDGHSLSRRAGIGQPQSLPKIIMQFVAGGSLQERIDQEGPLELKEILRIAMQTAAGLAAAHAQGVVHRDVKPANILLENGVQRVKLTDFGLARVMDDASLTLSGVIAGTPQYMAPEQAWGRDVDARADLFSLGAVMYAMCSGHSPFRARTTMAVLKRVCDDSPRPLRAINPDVPDWMVAIIEKLLAKNPNERFQSATEVSELLGRWLAHAQQPTIVPAPPRVHGSSRRVPFQSQAAADTTTASGSVGPGAVPSLSNKESVFMALAMVGACVPFAGLVMFHFATLPPPALPLDPGLRYLILSMFWGQFLTLVVTTAINFHRKSLGVIPTTLQCAALCLTIYFIPVAIMGFRLLGKRMKSDSPVDENSARHGSPEPVVSPIGSSPDFSRGTDDKGDQRTTLGDAARGLLPVKFVVWPLIVMLVLLGLMFAVVLGTGTHNVASFLGFSVFQLLATFVLVSVFRAAWNSSSWVVWIASLLFLPFVASLFGYAASFRDAVGLVQWMSALQALTAMAYWLGLLFVRPLFIHESDPRLAARHFSWRRVLALTCLLLVPVTASVFWLMRTVNVNNRMAHEATRSAAEMAPADPVIVSPARNPRQPQLDERGFPNPQLLSNREPNSSPFDPVLPENSQTPATTRDSLKPLLGRWVVVSSEGAALGSVAVTGMMGSSGGGPAGAPASSGSAAPGGMAGMFGGSEMGGRVSAAASPLQWIEFAADHVVVFGGQPTNLFAEFSEEVEPKQITLRDQPNPQSVGAIVWRRGIFRLERDRLIVCWTTGDRLPPTEFVTEDHYAAQLLILRREWNPPPDLLPPGESAPPPPRAVIPFTADEAKRYQEAWASSANVPVETTNSLGMKLRLIPAGAFDPAGAASFEKIPLSSAVASSIPSIYLSAHEVTVAQFRKFVEATKYETTAERYPSKTDKEQRSWKHPGIVQDGDQHPVVCVSWQDANAFCRWLSDTEQQQYRLPSVAEWSFAARVGVASSTPLKLPHNARLRFFDTTAPVGGAHANLFGLHDLFGNVGEWANDNLEEQGFVMTFHRAALGGGYRSKRKPDTGIEWLLPQIVGPSEHLDDVGFRVARVIHRDAEVLSGSLPPIEKLFASSAQVTILVNPERAKVPREKSAKSDGDDKPLDSKNSDDPKAKLESGEWKPSTGPVVALRGLVPVGLFPASPNIVDFEIERASGGRLSQNVGPPDMNGLSWMKVDRQKALDLLDQTDFVPDTVPSLLTDPVYTMPLISRSDAPWGELATTGWLPQVEPGEPRSKYAVEFRLFRYFDFDVAKDQRWAYRVRLKLASPKDSTDKNGLFTPWAMTEQWVTIP